MADEAAIGKAVRQATFGRRVDRATATLPQTAAAAIFNILGGRIILAAIVGEVTVLIQTVANATKLTSNPTVGTSVDICATLDITADEVRCLYGITGLPSDALVGTNAGFAPVPYRRQALPVGTIDLDCAGSATGSVKWSILYIPLDDGAYVTAA